MNNRCLVIGSNGFIGSNLSVFVKQEHSVSSFNRSPEFKCMVSSVPRSLSTVLEFSTLLKTHYSHDFKAIINCIGSSSIAQSFNCPYDDFMGSVANVTTILEHIRTISPEMRPRLVLLSSAAVYGNNSNKPLVEDNTLEPISPYGANKALLEKVAYYYHHFFGLKISIIRPFSIYGEGQKKQLLWDASVKFVKGENHFFGTGKEVRDWLHVDDLSTLLLATALNDEQKDFEIYNAGGVHLSVKDILSRLSYYLNTGGEPEFTGEEHHGNPRCLISDSSKAISLLSWTSKINIDEGLKRYANWFKRVYSK